MLVNPLFRLRSSIFLLDNWVRMSDVAISAPMGVDFNALPASGGTFSGECGAYGWCHGLDGGGFVCESGLFSYCWGCKTSPTTGIQTIDYGVNTGVARTGQVTFTSVGGTGFPTTRTVEFTQLGATPTLTVETIPADLNLAMYSSGTRQAEVLRARLPRPLRWVAAQRAGG